MNQLGSKLANSVRQAKTAESAETVAAVEEKVAVQVAEKVVVASDDDDAPLPLFASRRVWPD